MDKSESKVDILRSLDAVYFDDVTGVAGTDWPIGTPGVPSDVEADILTILTARKLLKVHIANESYFTLSAGVNHLSFTGDPNPMGTGGLFDSSNLTVQDCNFENLYIVGGGIWLGWAFFRHCWMALDTTTVFRGTLRDCWVEGDFQLYNLAIADWDHCRFVDTPIIDANGCPGLKFEKCTGNLTLDNLTAVVVSTVELDDGTLTLNASCNAGTLHVYGNCVLVNNSTMTVIDHRVTGINILIAALGLSTFSQETVIATDVNGVTWKDLLDKSAGGASPITKFTEIWGIKVTRGGVWAGVTQLRFTDGTNKIFPFAAQAEEGTDFVDTIVWMFPDPIKVPVSTGYKLQFRSTNGADGAGETLTLDELDIITRG